MSEERNFKLSMEKPHFKGSEKDLAEWITKEIDEKYGVGKEKASILAGNLIDQIRAHGGNPYTIEETRSCIDVVVAKWIELEPNAPT